ncbi:MAG: electron transfer flavoprotein subunit beta/FixA family protein [Actinobacteria bacterium]|nr:electron transfer flavoprotein subunit beta/FixA family protein [Actinomycetota bacterium]
MSLRVLVCVKRVPAPGARIPISEDGRSVDGRHLAFTVSPHEECAVEEAIRLKETHGGSVTVMTLGPGEAEEQLRAAISVGADNGVLLQTDGSDWDPQATSAALGAHIAELEARGGVFDLILFGNESADSGGYQVGIRVARKLGRPVISGVKGLSVQNGTAEARRDTGADLEVYRLPLPAVIAVKEGLNLPRYPTLPGRLRAKSAQITAADVAARSGGLQLMRLVNPPEEASTTMILGHGPETAPAIVDIFEELGLI